MKIRTSHNANIEMLTTIANALGDIKDEFIFVGGCATSLYLTEEHKIDARPTILVGTDGWADGRFGEFFTSQVNINDSRLIEDLSKRKIDGKVGILDKMQELADNDADQLKQDLIKVVEKKEVKKILIVTHVPPFRESCKHLGKISDPEWLPYFSSKATGDVLLNIAMENPNIEFLTLCGHTHSQSYYQPLENLTVKAGVAQYFEPVIQEVISF